MGIPSELCGIAELCLEESDGFVVAGVFASKNNLHDAAKFWNSVQAFRYIENMSKIQLKHKEHDLNTTYLC